MDEETLEVVGKITHTYLYVLHDGEVVHRNVAAKLVAEELGLIEESSSKEVVERAQEKLLPLLDGLLEFGFLLSRPQKSVMIAPKGLEALIDHEGTFSTAFIKKEMPSVLSLQF